MIELTTFDDFESASRATLAYLHQRFGFDLWMMTRVEGSDCLVLQAESHGYDIEEGTVFRWGDSFCSQMVLEHGPRIVPHAKNVPLFSASPIAQKVPIGAYIGVPLASTDGSLFGTLCAIDPHPKEESIRDELPMIEFLARLLGTILIADLKAAKQARLLERSQQAARTDVLTGLLNRHGWEQSVAIEEARAKRYGSPACVLIVDLDELKQTNDTKGHVHGDALIRSASNSIRSALRENDIVARIGGDEFAILGIECDAEGCETIFKNVTNALLSNGISASVGKALRDHRLGLFETIAAADRNMYVAKAKRRMRCSRKNS